MFNWSIWEKKKFRHWSWTKDLLILMCESVPEQQAQKSPWSVLHFSLHFLSCKTQKSAYRPYTRLPRLQESGYRTILKIHFTVLPVRAGMCKRGEGGFVCRGKQHTDFHTNHLLNKYMHHNVELHEQKRQSVQNWLPFVLILTLTICCSSDKGFKTEN